MHWSRLRSSRLLAGALVAVATVVSYLGPLRGTETPSDALGDATRPYVLSSPIFTPKTGTSFTTLFTSIEDTSMSMLLRRYDAVGTLLTSQAITIGAHGSLQASPAAHSGAPLHVEIWAPKPGIHMRLTYTNSSDATVVIEPGDMIKPRGLGTTFEAMSPTRICNTLDGQGTPCQGQTLGANGTLNVTAAGVAGIPSFARSVALTAQVVNPTGSTSYLTFWPAGEARPNASQVTFRMNDRLSGFVVVKLGAGGAFSVFNKNGNTDVLLDVSGYYA